MTERFFKERFSKAILSFHHWLKTCHSLTLVYATSSSYQTLTTDIKINNDFKMPQRERCSWWRNPTPTFNIFASKSRFMGQENGSDSPLSLKSKESYIWEDLTFLGETGPEYFSLIPSGCRNAIMSLNWSGVSVHAVNQTLMSLSEVSDEF